jgi:anti-sigma B factor antagonist
VADEEVDWDLRSTGTPDRAVLHASGELDLDTSPRLYAEVDRLLRAGQPTLVIDLSDLVFVDSSGLGTLVACWRRAEQAGTILVILNARDDVALSLQITGLDQILPLETVADAA